MNSRTFANKLVFVGTTALGTRRSSPLRSTRSSRAWKSMPRLRIPAAGRLPVEARASHRLETQLVIGFGALALLFLRFGLVWGPLTTIGCGAALWGMSYWMLSSSGTFLSCSTPPWASAGALASMTAAGLLVERRRADHRRRRTPPRGVCADAAVADRHPRSRNWQAFGANTELTRASSRSSFRSIPASTTTSRRSASSSSPAWRRDIGKVGVPDRVLNKPGELTPDELAEMQGTGAWSRRHRER